jgi:hypothetical protein
VAVRSGEGSPTLRSGRYHDAVHAPDWFMTE